MEDSIIRVEHLTKDYGKGRGVFDISLDVHRGEVFGYIGTNGSGKTTTIRNMMGFIRPEQGISSILGKDSWKESAEMMKNVSYVPGEIAFPALASGTAFLKSQAEYLGVKDFTYMNHLIEVLQLDPTANLKRMSKGMKQKTALVAALMGEKEVLVLDEPTTGLDPLMRESFLDLIREEKKKGHTVFMSSHIFEEIEEVCDRVAMIKDGRIIDTVTLDDLRNPKEKRVQAEFSSEADRDRFLRETGFSVIERQGSICTFNVPTADLNLLFGTLKNYSIKGLHEESVSLEQHFMNIYRKGELKNGNK